MQQLQHNLASFHRLIRHTSPLQESLTSHMHENLTTRAPSERSSQYMRHKPRGLEKKYEKLKMEIKQIKLQATSSKNVTRNWKTMLTTPLSL